MKPDSMSMKTSSEDLIPCAVTEQTVREENDESIEDFVDEFDFDNEVQASNSQAIQTMQPMQTTMEQQIDLTHIVTDKQTGSRIDKLASQVFEGFSRAQLQDWINADKLTVNDSPQKPKYRVRTGDVLHLSAELEQHGEDLPEDIDIEVLYEDEDVLVVNKPVGMVVHPGAGNWTGTLVNGLLYHYPNQKHLPRAGLVHRIDKDTSGLLIIGKTKTAQLELMEQLKDKSVYRHYKCVVAGDAEDLQRHRVIDKPIGRHRTQRTKMTVMQTGGKDAVTHLIDITPLKTNYSLVDVALETGRTHQIRVHLSHLGYPLIGDAVYGGRQQMRAGLTDEQRAAIRAFPRQALHAYQLGFIHPTTGEDILVTSDIPDDMLALIDVLSEE